MSVTYTINSEGIEVTYQVYQNQGPPGEGVPPGGTTGQILAKSSEADYDTDWIDNTGGGGGIPEAPADGSAYLRKGSDSSWVAGLPVAGGTITGTLVIGGGAQISINSGGSFRSFSGSTITIDNGPDWLDAIGAAPLSLTDTESSNVRELALSDIGRYIRLTNASPCAITLLQDSDIAWPMNCEIYFRVATTVAPIFTQETNVTINNRDTELTEHSTFALKKIAANTWDLI